MDDPAGALVLSGLAAVAGGILRDRSALLAELHAGRAEMADRRRDELEVARLEERAALGRELHDSLGHALTVIALQAGAARRLEADDPAAAAAARETIAETATRALHDARGGFSAGAHDVGDLVATARAAGVPTRVTGPAPPPELAPVVFRVVQEALTNVMRHAPGSPVEICFLGPEDRSGYACTVTNPLPPATARRTTYPSAGRGLAGLRSRVEEVGGVADWRAADGRFSLEVRFPAPVGARA
jgi:signal transduction histidine kinase